MQAQQKLQASGHERQTMQRRARVGCLAGGRSLMAQLIKDAGGEYLWKDNTEVSGVPLDLLNGIQQAAASMAHSATTFAQGGGGSDGINMRFRPRRF